MENLDYERKKSRRVRSSEKPVDKVNVTEYLNDLNKTLCLSTPSSLVWQRGTRLRVTWPNHCWINKLQMGSRAHNTYEQQMLMWLAYEDQLTIPVGCSVHSHTLHSGNINDKLISFNVNCERACFAKSVQSLCLVFVECDYYRYQWTSIPIAFGEEVVVSEPLQMLLHLTEISQKIESLQNDVDHLRKLLMTSIQGFQ